MGIHRQLETFDLGALRLELSDNRTSQLGKIGTPLVVDRGQTAAFDREVDQVVYIQSGATKLTASISDAREQIVAFHFSGDLVSLPANRLHSYALAALVDSELLAFPANAFFDIASADKAMARYLFEAIPAALHRCRDKAVSLGRKNATERLAGFLVAMAERIGRRKGKSCLLDLPMSRREISDSLGLTIETVSRQLGVLKEAGLVETQGRSQIIISDIAKLTSCAAHCDD